MSRETDPQVQPVAAGQPADTAQGGWLQRWSQRKHRGGDADGVDSAEAPPQGNGVQPAAMETRGDTAQPAPADEAEEPVLPPIESLDEHSDYRGFMSDKVSEELRLLALRKLFSLPQFNIRDGLNDYDEDFSRFKPLGDVVPHDMARSLERALKKGAEPARREQVATTAAVAPQAPPAVQSVTSGAEGDSGQSRERGSENQADGQAPAAGSTGGQ